MFAGVGAPIRGAGTATGMASPVVLVGLFWPVMKTYESASEVVDNGDVNPSWRDVGANTSICVSTPVEAYDFASGEINML
jgi:hypothetical protein